MAKVTEKSQKSTLPPDNTGVADLAEEITKRIGNLVSGGSKVQVVAQMVSLVEERFAGPIAHPRHLREYEDICPGAADRIIRMAESNLSHAQNIQTVAIKGDIADVSAGRIYGFSALLALILAALGATYLDHDVIAAAFLGAGAIGVIGQLIQGRQRTSDT